MALPIRSLFGRLSLSPNPQQLCMSTPASRTRVGTQSLLTQCAPFVSHFPSQQRSFGITSASQAKEEKSKRRRKKGRGEEPDPRIVNIKLSTSRRIGAPLRFGRNRYLRHWTIHRAWLLWQRQEREREERDLMRLYQSMSNACEELRKTSGPGNRGEGYLYRVATEKRGIYEPQGIPIEYSRPQTETPARIPWNHEWTRD